MWFCCESRNAACEGCCEEVSMNVCVSECMFYVPAASLAVSIYVYVRAHEPWQSTLSKDKVCLVKLESIV